MACARARRLAPPASASWFAIVAAPIVGGPPSRRGASSLVTVAPGAFARDPAGRARARGGPLDAPGDPSPRRGLLATRFAAPPGSGARSSPSAREYNAHASSLPTTRPFLPPASAETALAGMNDEQRAAILAPVRPVKVLAGPGSGKTRVLVGRVTHLINALGVPPSHILCITFTNKAANEMRERLAASVGHQNASMITAGTFHSVASRMLRKHVHLLENYGRGNDFAIFDEADTRALLRKILVDRFHEDKKKVDPGLAKGRISAAKSAVDHCVGLPGHRMLRALIASRPNLSRDPGVTNRFAQLYDEYEANLRASNALDFDDLLSASVALLRTSEEARTHYQQRWRHVLVDEFQDTSQSQYELIRAVASPQNNVFVVGDVDQAIYGWRGAEVANIRERFDADYKDPVEVLLSKNYRSTSTIVKAAQAVIGCSRAKSALELDAVQPGGRDVAVVATEDDVEEAEFCAREAAKCARAGAALKDIAVLFRTHSQSRVLEEAFIRAGVPHVVVGDTAFYTRKEIKDCVAYLRALANPRDAVALARIVNVPPRKIGPGTVEKLERWAQTLPWDDGMPQPLGQALLHRGWADPGVPDDQLLPAAEEMGLGKAAHRAVGDFVGTMRRLRDRMETKAPGAVIEDVIETVGLEAYVSDQENGEERWGFVKELVSLANAPEATAAAGAAGVDDDAAPGSEGASAAAAAARAIGAEGLNAFLEGIALLMSAETRSEDEAADAVRLMTLHASKGLEFDVVFIAGCEDKLIPFARDDGAGEAEDEEVRLFYVGLTRARKKLFLCRAFKRQRFGRTEYADPSPFLEVIREALVGGGSAGGGSNNRSGDAPSSAFGSSDRLAAHLAASGARVAMGNSPAFRGRGGRGYGRGGGVGVSGSGRGGGRRAAEERAPPTDRSGAASGDADAAARRAARRAAAARRAGASAVRAADKRRDAPRPGRRKPPTAREE